METCANCRFWLLPPKHGENRPIGMCRRRGPVPLLIGSGVHPVTHQPFPVINGFFPETRPDVWCGDHEPRPVRAGVPLLDIDLSKLSIEGAEQ